LDGTDIVYILRVPTKKIMTISLSIGSRLPAYCTSMGRVLLGGLSDAELEAVLSKSELKAITPHTVTDPARLQQIIREDRSKGWSLVNQELEEGLVSLSVPIQDRTGRIIAAMNVSGQATRTSASEMVRNILPELQRTASQIGDALKMRAA
jgi:IclR family pca regulon transcriptional regulator